MPAIEVPHPNTGSVASPAEIYEWARRHVPSSAQAVFIGGDALRAIGVIAALEDDLRRPVLTANQVSCGMRYAWQVQRSAWMITASCSNCHADNPKFPRD